MQDHPRSIAPRARVVGVRTDAPSPRPSTRCDGVVAILVVAVSASLLWSASCSGRLGFEVGGHGQGTQLLDRTVAELRNMPFDELAALESAQKDEAKYRIEYSVRRKRHDTLEIQAALVDRIGGGTLDRFVTWRSRSETTASVAR